jgi:hypothetical protein
VMADHADRRLRPQTRRAAHQPRPRACTHALIPSNKEKSR